MTTIDTIYGTFGKTSQKRIELTFDYENGTIHSFRDIAQMIGAETFLDIGANIGVYSVFLSKVPSIKRIHAFEPAPAAYPMLVANVSIQKRRAIVSTHCVAASDARSTVNFKLISPISGANAIVNSADGDDVIQIDAVPIDEILQFKNTVTAVKIDVEGHELQALTGMRRLLTENSCFLQIESLRPAIKSDLSNLLQSIGYSSLFSMRNDHFYINQHLEQHRNAMIKTISDNLVGELRDLLQLRRERRKHSAEAKNLWKAIAYERNPIFAT